MQSRHILRQRLLRWYDLHQRDLPWRVEAGQTPDPYRVWLSEVMLQQTRVETVKSYYARWLGRFPTLESLGEASQDEVLKAWEGLGYYSRARNFHRAVREVLSRYGGQVPADPAAFRSLPGVGRYTAGAVMSIAYGLDQPVVDGNVRRVFARILDVAEPSESLLWMEAGQLVTGGRPGDLNQALMELGATLCTPRSPQCEKCPIAEFCTAHRNGTQAERPLKRRPRRVPQERHGVAVVAWEENLLLVRRPADGRLGGMWEFPGVLRHPGETIAAAAGRAAQEWAGLSVAVEGPLGVVEHAFTHVRVRYEAMWAAVDPDRGPPPTSSHDQGIAWVSRSGLDAYALPRAQRRIAALIEAGS